MPVNLPTLTTQVLHFICSLFYPISSRYFTIFVHFYVGFTLFIYCVVILHHLGICKLHVASFAAWGATEVNCKLATIYMAHAVAFAAIRTTKTREHKNCPSSASTIARAEICLGCWRESPISQPHTLGLRRGYSDGKAVGNTTGLRRRLHPHWRIFLLQSLCRALGQTEASSNF